ncbi:hypothetical protein Cantr_03923 [Candida viswanathii]|uniref:LCCL domain-containing protein n=1 Tax=Candida viswanathii TaxID=5486 RepID=A0A367XPE9_9ASCO|nr:hypothetical protein Cantr_03923 [Candida viswanathii]
MKPPSSSNGNQSTSNTKSLLESDIENIELQPLDTSKLHTSASDSSSNSNTTMSDTLLSNNSAFDDETETGSTNSATTTTNDNNIRIVDDDTTNFYFQQDNSFKSRFKRFFYLLWHGPLDPRDDPAPRISFSEFFEVLPDKFRARVPLPYRRALLVTYLLFWFGLCYNILVPYLTIPPYLSNDPSTHIYTLSCGPLQQFWKGKNGACGFNGSLCPEVTKSTDEAHPESDIFIRCPALCDRSSWTYSLIPIGDQRIKYRGYFVGGGSKVDDKLDDNQITNPYRGDSYPCGAGVHAGVISPFWGGCARISYNSKDRAYFKSAKGQYGVSDSIEFLSFFKFSYFFKNLRLPDQSSFNHCYDPRLVILVMNIILGLPVVYLGSGAVAYWTISICGFWTICLATDPPVDVDPNRTTDFAHLLSVALERFLPSCCILYVLWHVSAKRTLSQPVNVDGSNMKISYLSRVFLWYPMFWLGVLNNMTFDRLPVDRLTISDLKEQSGALLAVGSIVLTITTCAFIQAYKLWLSGRFRKYLFVYSMFVLGLVLLSQLPNLTLRVHHYILAMLLIPGCATRGRTALLFQGILLGLFLSGAARWGLAAIAETAESLRRDDPKGNIIPPLLTGYNNETGVLEWMNFSADVKLTKFTTMLYEKYSSISILVNDIEQYVGDKVESVNLRELFTTSADLKKEIEEALANGIKDENGDILIYLRIGRKVPNTNYYSDFSNAAVLKYPSGELTLPLPGMT